ncbi:MAG: hypothetical protein A2X36_14105 [Elusimicrobia bacterium GWA2_69_24]|nr:MAG: hypothetical protein A2X36_14105 [Elusimicrobia bacterium GWA2_69_24]HBL17615.1 hypothetical protein [Elusimicrobiota bacterium]
MLPINYHHLYYFWVVAKAGRISQACRQLLLSQSTLSMQIQQLERSFGKQLLHRSRKGVALTPEGRIAFDYCERIFSQGEELAAALRPGCGLTPARLRLGITGSVSRHVVTQILERVYRIDRRLRVSLLEGLHEDLRERLEKHRLDVVVSNIDFANDLGLEFRSRLVGALPIDFVAVPKLGKLIRRFPADLATLPMFLNAPENPVRKEIDLFLCRHRVVVSVEAEIDDFDLLRFLVLRGRGVAAMDALTVRQDIAQGRLVRINPRPVSVKEYIWFTCGRHPKPNPILQEVMSELLEGFEIRV